METKLALAGLVALFGCVAAKLASVEMSCNAETRPHEIEAIQDAPWYAIFNGYDLTAGEVDAPLFEQAMLEVSSSIGRRLPTGADHTWQVVIELARNENTSALAFDPDWIKGQPIRRCEVETTALFAPLTNVSEQFVVHLIPALKTFRTTHVRSADSFGCRNAFFDAPIPDITNLTSITVTGLVAEAGADSGRLVQTITNRMSEILQVPALAVYTDTTPYGFQITPDTIYCSFVIGDRTVLIWDLRVMPTEGPSSDDTLPQEMVPPPEARAMMHPSMPVDGDGPAAPDAAVFVPAPGPMGGPPMGPESSQEDFQNMPPMF